MSDFSLSAEDRGAVERQIGRTLRGNVRVAVRCPCGLPSVIETHPLLDGVPFPTLFWLTCVRASRAVGKLEASGAMRELTERLRTDEGFRLGFERACEDYVARRDAHHRLDGAGAIGGGPTDRVKCLHAQLAHQLVCGCNPVGEWVGDRIGEVFVPPPCVG